MRHVSIMDWNVTIVEMEWLEKDGKECLPDQSAIYCTVHGQGFGRQEEFFEWVAENYPSAVFFEVRRGKLKLDLPLASGGDGTFVVMEGKKGGGAEIAFSPADAVAFKLRWL